MYRTCITASPVMGTRLNQGQLLYRSLWQRGSALMRGGVHRRSDLLEERRHNKTCSSRSRGSPAHGWARGTGGRALEVHAPKSQHSTLPRTSLRAQLTAVAVSCRPWQRHLSSLTVVLPLALPLIMPESFESAAVQHMARFFQVNA